MTQVTLRQKYRLGASHSRLSWACSHALQKENTSLSQLIHDPLVIQRYVQSVSNMNEDIQEPIAELRWIIGATVCGKILVFIMNPTASLFVAPQENFTVLREFLGERLSSSFSCPCIAVQSNIICAPSSTTNNVIQTIPLIT